MRYFFECPCNEHERFDQRTGWRGPQDQPPQNTRAPNPEEDAYPSMSIASFDRCHRVTVRRFPYGDGSKASGLRQYMLWQPRPGDDKTSATDPPVSAVAETIACLCPSEYSHSLQRI